MTTSCYEIGDIPPLGEVPARMYASVIRPERYGPPIDAFRTEVVDVPPLGPGQVLVMMMAAGVNYNNVWAALGKPLDVIAARRRRDDTGFHIGGSEGPAWCGRSARGPSGPAGDHVVLSGCQWDESAADIRAGADPMTSSSQRVWGTRRTTAPSRSSRWSTSTSAIPAGAADLGGGGGVPADRGDRLPAALRLAAARGAPGDPVLIWGGPAGSARWRSRSSARTGRTGRRRLQRRPQGTLPRAWALRVSSTGASSTTGSVAGPRRPTGLRGLAQAGTRLRAAVLGGPRRAARTPHRAGAPGQDTIPTSMYLCDTAGMVVICGGTSGYHADVDLRFLWMRQKRLQGSHFANVAECRAITALVDAGRVDPAWPGRGRWTTSAGRTS
ncbi:crotonyl-CoA carboxylase/reductase [Micromonospora sp. M12]